MIAHDHDSNAMLALPLKTKSALEKLQKIQETHKFLNDRGIHPKINIIGNECPKTVKDCLLHAKKIELLLVPLCMRRVNIAEKAIDSSKKTLCLLPIHLEPRVSTLPMGKIATTSHHYPHLLQSSRINPRISVEE